MHMQTSDYGVSCRSFGTLITISIPPLLLPHVLSCYCILRFTALYVNYLVILVSSLNHTGEIHLLPSSLHPLPRHYYYYISIHDYISFYLSSLSDFIAQESKQRYLIYSSAFTVHVNDIYLSCFPCQDWKILQGIFSIFY